MRISKKTALEAMRAAAMVGEYVHSASIAKDFGIWICAVCVQNAPRIISDEDRRGKKIVRHELVCDRCRYRIPNKLLIELRTELPDWWVAKQKRSQEMKDRYRR